MQSERLMRVVKQFQAQMLNMIAERVQCVSNRACACCLASLKAELLERADKLGVEVSVLSRREGRFRRLSRCCVTKFEQLDSCDGI